MYIDVFPIKGAPKLECFDIVQKHVQENQGRRVLGWCLWELPDLFIEVEFHAVWQTPDGHLLDLTPRKTPTKRILFIEDQTIQYDGKRVKTFVFLSATTQ